MVSEVRAQNQMSGAVVVPVRPTAVVAGKSSRVSLTHKTQAVEWAAE